MKLIFRFQLPLQNIFPELMDRILYASEIIDLLQLRAIVVEYQELPLAYLPEVIEGEYICQLDSLGVQDEPALLNIWPKNSGGQLQEMVNILADLELIFRDGDYKQFLVKPKRIIDVMEILEFDPLTQSHNLGLFNSTSTGPKNSKQL